MASRSGSPSRPCLLALVAGVAVGVDLRAAHLVADLDPRTTVVSSNPAFFASHAGVTYFAADDDRSGQELWRTDGTPGGTRLVADFAAGGASSHPWPVVTFGDRFLVALTDPDHGRELWLGEGPDGPLTRLTDLCQGTCSGVIGQPVVLGELAYFTGYVHGEGAEPWVTDGTSAGTRRLAVTCPELCTSPHRFAQIGPHVVFNARYRELWRTDGTPEGTHRLATPPRCCTDVSGFVPFANALFFAAGDPTWKIGRELWVTDGQTVSLAAEYAPGTSSSNPDPHFAFDDRLWLTTTTGCPASQPPTTRCLWREDGDPASPLELVPGVFGSLRAWAINGSTLYFVDDFNGSDRLLALRAGDPGPVLLWTHSQSTTPLPLGPFQLVPLRDGVAFAIGNLGEVWFANLPPADLPVLPMVYELTANAADVEAAAWLSTTPFGLAWQAARGGDRELWVSDGTVAGTREIPLAHNQASGAPIAVGLAADTFFFSAWDGTSGGRRTSFSTAGDPEAVTSHEPLMVSEAARLGERTLVSARQYPGPEGLWRLEGETLQLLDEIGSRCGWPSPRTPPAASACGSPPARPRGSRYG
jgi:ELWxxDGT repeat protein